MRKNIHPNYQEVLFIDSASGHRFVCGSTLKTDAKETFQGKEYPVSYLSISSTSHPFFTGSKQLVDSEGRVEKFNKRFGPKKVVEAEASSDVVQAEGSTQDHAKKSDKSADKKTAKPAAKKRG